MPDSPMGAPGAPSSPGRREFQQRAGEDVGDHDIGRIAGTCSGWATLQPIQHAVADGVVDGGVQGLLVVVYGERAMRRRA
jgi:hypothetical protein